jgi:hypothetical protein
MNERTKELGRNMRKLRTSLKHVHWTTRADYCWTLLEECMEDGEQINWVGNKWKLFLSGKIKEIDARCNKSE